MTPPFERVELRDGLGVQIGRIPDALLLPPERFEELWAMHPPELPKIVLQEKSMTAPRWHQAYGRDYEFAGWVSKAQPVPEILQPILQWTQESVDARINGILVNWYDAVHEHRIAIHKDSPIGRVAGAPIVTVSLGAARTFQMIVGKKRRPFRVGDGDCILIPDETNKRFAHSVPHLPGDEGRRISITLRAFDG